MKSKNKMNIKMILQETRDKLPNGTHKKIIINK